MDLRVAPVALGCWSAALTLLLLGQRTGLILVALTVLCGIGLSRWLPRWRWVILAAGLGLTCGAVATGGQLSTRDSAPLTALVAERATVEVELTIRDDPRPAIKNPRLWVIPASLTRVGDGLTLAARVLVLAENGAWQGLLPGQRVRVSVRFGRPGGGDLRAAVLSTADDPARLGGPPLTQTSAGGLRDGLQRACEPLADRPGGLLPGLVVGDTSRLDPALRQQFLDTGMSHLTAVSGTNVAVVSGSFLLIGRWLRLRPALTAGLAAAAIVGFVILARPSPSVLRAAVMGGIGLLALAGGRSRAAMPALAATITLLIVADPELASDAGFTLSVFATGGLLVLAPPMRDALRRRGVPAGVAEAIAIPASAQLACAPVIAGLNGSVSLVAIPANLLAVPAVAPATICGVLAAAISPIWPAAAEFVAWLGAWPAWWLVRVAEVGSAVPAGTLPWPAGLAGALLLAAITLGLVAGLSRPVLRRFVLAGLLAVLLGAMPVRLLTAAWPPSGWIMVVCDVAQGDAIVLRTGPGSAVVVDTGPDPSGVLRCLRELDVEAVPLLLLTHLHADHAGGLAGVLRLRPEQVILPDFPEPRSAREQAILSASGLGIQATAAAPGARWTVGELTLRVLSTEPLRGTRSDPNNNSLLLYAEIRGATVLLLGDAEIEQQALLIGAYPGLAADVVKIAHHGSAYQDVSLIDRIAPRIALISVGVDNGYGHPNPAFLARVQRGGARVLRTDIDGDIAVVAEHGRLLVAVK